MTELAERNGLKLVEKEPIVKIKNVTKHYNGICALDNVSLDIPRGKIIGLLGENGSGKTTLLKILTGFISEYEGEVSIDGYKVGAETKARVAYLPDKGGLPKDMQVEQLVKLYSRFFDDFDESRCKELLALFDIKEQSKPKEMSKGMVDKLQICLLMSRKAELYLLDEPIGGVDVAAREHILDLIIQNFNPEGTMIIVTHLVRDIEKLFDSVVILSQGKIKAFDDCDVLREKYGGSLEDALKEMLP